MLAFIHANAQYDFDHFRHWLAYTFNIVNWATNGSEQLVAIIIGAMITYIVWPKFRHAMDGWIKGHMHASNEELHRKLDHIIKHHPDIPPLPPKEGVDGH